MVEDQNRTVRIQLLLTPEEAKTIDDWRFANRSQSRNEAIRRLIEAGLKVEAVAEAEFQGLMQDDPTEDAARDKAARESAGGDQSG